MKIYILLGVLLSSQAWAGVTSHWRVQFFVGQGEEKELIREDKYVRSQTSYGARIAVLGPVMNVINHNSMAQPVGVFRFFLEDLQDSGATVEATVYDHVSTYPSQWRAFFRTNYNLNLEDERTMTLSLGDHNPRRRLAYADDYTITFKLLETKECDDTTNCFEDLFK